MICCKHIRRPFYCSNFTTMFASTIDSICLLSQEAPHGSRFPLRSPFPEPVSGPYFELWKADEQSQYLSFLPSAFLWLSGRSPPTGNPARKLLHPEGGSLFHDQNVWQHYTIESSSRKSMTLILRTPLSSYQRLRMSCRTMILGKESPVRENGLFSTSAFSSVPRAYADWM